jgi:hypothetical protein
MVGWVLSGISLRGACNVLAAMQAVDVKWGFHFPVPHFTTVRTWLLRLGHYNLHRPKEHADDWVWIIDHSNQIGQEKCLLILGVRASQLPPPGKDFALRLAQMEPIELEPVTVSDKEVVWRQLEANTAKTGAPRAIISDHGGDLAGGIELFRKQHPETLDIYDITHKAACLLKAQLERDKEWSAFASLAAQTKCKIQQTEWAFLVAPSQQSKARYMNLGELVRWGIKTLAILDNPGPAVLRHGTVERLEQRLGWLRQFRDGLTRWSQMEAAIDEVVDFVRTQGLYRGAGEDLRKRLRGSRFGETAERLGEDLAVLVSEQGDRLRHGERLPGSSEVLESCFGKFKALERQQSKGGFTSLLLALTACVSQRTPEVVHEALQTSKTADVINWFKTKLGQTLGSKRRLAYQSPKPKRTATKNSKSETELEGTPMLAPT